MCRRASERVAFGRPIAEQGVVRDWIAESRVRIEQLRLLVLKTAWLMDTVGNKGAHTEIQAIKIATPKTVEWILDKAIQTHGAAGLSQDTELAAAFAGIRTLRFADGPDEVHKNALAKAELREVCRPLTAGGRHTPAERPADRTTRPDRTTKGPTMDFDLSAEEREIRDWVRTFVRKEIVPLEPQVLERERRGERGLTADELKALQDKARSSGFFGIQTPESHGGMGQGAVVAALIEIELGRSFVPFRFAGEADNILFSATEEQQETYLRPTIEGTRKSCFAITEPGAGSDARAIRTSARREGDEWVINGEKTFITGGNEADFVMVFAVTDKEKGADGGVTCFLVDRDRGWTSTPIDTMGEWGPAALVFEDVRVPHSAILGEEGKGFELAMRWIGKGRYMLPARALGSCERLVEMGMEWARNRVTFGQPIAERQAIQWMVADSAVEIEALRWLVLTAAWQVDRGLDSRQSQSMAKLYGGVKANEIVDRVLQMHGGMGYTRELPVERWYRELRLLRIYEGTDEIQRRTIARNLLKGHASVRGHLG